MSTALTSGPGTARDEQDADSRRGRVVRRLWLSVAVLAIVGFVAGGVLVFGWMVDETHFDRPSAEFDEFGRQVDGLSGVDLVDKQRWVEAPTFADPTSWISVTVDEAGLPGLLEAACSNDYPDAVTWSIRVQTPAGAEVSLNAAPTDTPAAGGDPRCPDFGFDAVRLVRELDHVAPGLVVQPAIWENGRFALVTLEDQMPSGFTHVLPLIEHADALLEAAGVGPGEAVEINSGNLGFVLQPGELDAYFAMLSELADERGVTSYWADGGTPIDGVEKIQMVAPEEQHASIEEIIASSGLQIAELPVRFLEQ